MDLLFHYLKVIYRTTIRQFGYAMINIIGFAVGLAAASIVLLHVKNETSYEKNFADHDRTYRVWTKFMAMGNFAPGPDLLLEVLPEKYPFIESTCRLKRAEQSIIKAGEFTTEERGVWVEPNFFDMFDYPFHSGNRKSITQQQNSIVLSDKLAKTLFGDLPAIGQTVYLGKDEEPFQVSGVVLQEKVKSHLNTAFWLVSTRPWGADQPAGFDTNWLTVSSFSYVKLEKTANGKELQKALDDIVKEIVGPTVGADENIEEWMESDGAFRFYAQPIEDIHLKSELRFDLNPGGDNTTTQTLLVIGLIIIIMTGVNYINLATARATKRAREVGVKKVVGSTKSSLIIQFLVESLFLCLVAAILAIVFAEAFLVIFQKATGQELMTTLLNSATGFIFVFALAGIIGLLAGTYPAFFISSYKPGAVLKGSFSTSPGNQGFRNTLVIVQFVFSISLIIGSLTIFDQLQFMKNKDLGFVRENVLVINNARVLNENFKHFKETISNRAEIVNISSVRSLPGSSTSFSSSTLYHDSTATPLSARRFAGDYNYPTTLGYDFIAGRTFSKDRASDTSAVILNESAVRALELDAPIGKILNKGSTQMSNLEVIGVIRDFNYESFHNVIGPAMITLENDLPGKIIMRISTANPQPLIDHMTETWSGYLPDEAINYSFLDDNFTELMASERLMSQVVTMFTSLAVFISCLGLLGLASYLVSQRKKEISIRKVLGAGVGNILSLLNKKYVMLVILSLFISLPLSAWVMREWLMGFAYNAGLSVLTFIAAPLFMLLITLLTVGYQSMRTALEDPVKYLGEE